MPAVPGRVCKRGLAIILKAIWAMLKPVEVRVEFAFSIIKA